MSTKRPARTGNPDLRQIEKEIFSLLSPLSFKPLKLYEDKQEQKQKFRDTWIFYQERQRAGGTYAEGNTASSPQRVTKGNKGLKPHRLHGAYNWEPLRWTGNPA